MTAVHMIQLHHFSEYLRNISVHVPDSALYDQQRGSVADPVNASVTCKLKVFKEKHNESSPDVMACVMT